jgi:hypothetical protein
MLFPMKEKNKKSISIENKVGNEFANIIKSYFTCNENKIIFN